MKRGEIWTVSGGRDYAGKARPAVILQDDNFDGIASITICVFTTDPTEAPLFRLPIKPNEGNGLRSPSHLMVDKITTVSKGQVGEHPDPDVPVVEVLHQVDEMAEIATEAIEPPDDDHVSLPRRLEEGGEPRAVLTLSGRLVLVDRVVADAGLAQSIPLQVEALGTVRLRDPRVADQH